MQVPELTRSASILVNARCAVTILSNLRAELAEFPILSGALQAMDRDSRVEELMNLRFAMANFALQLDAFEARLKGRLPDISVANKIVAAMKERPRKSG